MKARSGRFNGILFVLCLAFSVIQLALYDNPMYALQYGKWGQYGIWSVIIGFAFGYCLIFLCSYLKRIRPVRTAFSFPGVHSMDILMTHFGTAELICMLNGTWYSVYFTVYPEDAFSWGNVILVFSLTAVCVGSYIAAKQRIQASVR